MRTVYLSGTYLPENEAKISIFDRGFLMADGVYEVTAVIGGKLVDFDGHAARLSRSLKALKMKDPMSRERLLDVHRELVRRNRINDGLVYLQVTRGSAGDRDFVFPDADTPLTVMMFTQDKPDLTCSRTGTEGIKIISIPDLRWRRRDIKTVQLLYSSLGKMQAQEAGCHDAWMVEDGHVTEGTSNNAYILRGNKIVTRHLGDEILHGITRISVLRMAREAQIEVEERAFTIDEAQKADEAFITSASSLVMPVIEIDGVPIGNGRPGQTTLRLREIYLGEMRQAAI